MKNRIYHSIIQLLIVALVGMGVSQAGGVLCSVGCSHCETAMTVSCCDDMVLNSGHGKKPCLPEKKSMPSGCDHAEICLDISGWLDMAGYYFSIDVENTSALVHAVVPPPRHSGFQTLSAFFHPPPPTRSSPIYTVNCSFLI